MISIVVVVIIIKTIKLNEEMTKMGGKPTYIIMFCRSLRHHGPGTKLYKTTKLFLRIAKVLSRTDPGFSGGGGGAKLRPGSRANVRSLEALRGFHTLVLCEL